MRLVKEQFFQLLASFVIMAMAVQNRAIIDIDKSWILGYFSVYVVACRVLPQGPFEVPEHH